MNLYSLAWPALGVFLAVYFRGILTAWLGLQPPKGIEKDVLHLQAELTAVSASVKELSERVGKSTLKSLMGKAV